MHLSVTWLILDMTSQVSDISYVRVEFAVYGKIIYGCISSLNKGYSDTPFIIPGGQWN